MFEQDCRIAGVMFPRGVGALLLALVGLLFVPAPAMAQLRCFVKATEGDRAGQNELVTARFFAHRPRKYPETVNASRIIFLPRPAGYGMFNHRNVTLDYRGTWQNPWILDQVHMSYRIRADELNRPLFAFLVLDSGEHIVRLGVDANGRDEFNTSAGDPKLVRISSVASDNQFLNALGKANSVTFELKYADGETVVRETFETKPTDLMRQLVPKLLKMDREDCWSLPDGVEE